MDMAVPISTKMPAPKMPVRRDQSNRPMLAPSLVRTRKVPRTEAKMPVRAIKIGSKTRFSSNSVGAAMSRAPAPTAARAMVAMMEPTYDSNRSAPMPATSPTLSPTLSATVAGLRGSSSGMPCSILPTRSAPTSAALVYMPPPTLANRAMEDAPNPNPATTLMSLNIQYITVMPMRPMPTTETPMTAPELKATLRAGLRPRWA